MQIKIGIRDGEKLKQITDRERQISKGDILLLAGIVIVCMTALIIWNVTRKTGAYAKVMVDGEAVKLMPIDEEAAYVYEDGEGCTNTIVTNNGRVEVTEANCPDKICVNHSAIHSVGETIICLPHKLVIEILEE